MKLSSLLVSMIVGLTDAQGVGLTTPQLESFFDPRIPRDCPILKPGPKGLDQAVIMLEALGGPQIGREEIPQNGKVAPGSGKVKGRRCVLLDALNCGFVTPDNVRTIFNALFNSVANTFILVVCSKRWNIRYRPV
jgi:hypothetical protein